MLSQLISYEGVLFVQLLFVKKAWKSHFLFPTVSASRSPVCRRSSVASFSVIFFLLSFSVFCPTAGHKSFTIRSQFHKSERNLQHLLSCVQSNYDFHNALKGSRGSVCLPNIDLGYYLWRTAQAVKLGHLFCGFSLLGHIMQGLWLWIIIPPICLLNLKQTTEKKLVLRGSAQEQIWISVNSSRSVCLLLCVHKLFG